MSQKISPRQRIHGMHETFVQDKLNEVFIGDNATRFKIIGLYMGIAFFFALALFLIVFAIMFAFYLPQRLLNA